MRGGPTKESVGLLEPACRLALAIFRDSTRAFAESDCPLARTLKPRDKESDALMTDIGGLRPLVDHIDKYYIFLIDGKVFEPILFSIQ